MPDVIVIGGGIAGISAAAALSPHMSVTLLETESALGYHASGRSAAMFEETYGNRVVRALNAASRPAHETAGVLSPRGMLMVARPSDEPAFEADLSGLGMVEITLDQARQHIPVLTKDIIRAAWHEAARDIDTDRLLQSYACDVRGHGGEIVINAAVKRIRWADCWHVESRSGSFTAGQIVNAAGAWADEIARMAGVPPVDLVPFRRSMARLPAPGGLDVRHWPMLFGPGESWYAKPDAGKWLVSPADEDPTKPLDVYADDLTIAEGIARYQPYVTEEVTRVETTWAGLRTFAPDRTPVIGEDPSAAGFIWCAGQGGYGFQTAPAAAALVAALATGSQPGLAPDIVAALSPTRFR